ncbi:hypothetical protein FLW53_12315 [Microbispora sp. SCL1-1]|nr:hypothetical protein FLW53_12315 [Microbispora sp. SCL1-1]
MSAAARSKLSWGSPGSPGSPGPPPGSFPGGFREGFPGRAWTGPPGEVGSPEARQEVRHEADRPLGCVAVTSLPA